MSNLSIAIIAGLVGSVATAFLSYLVQQLLAKKRREEEEARLAFVYLVKVTDMLTLETGIKVLTYMFKGIFEKIIKPKLEELKADNDALDMTQTICALAANLIKKFSEGKADSNAKLLMDSILESNKRATDEFSISPHLLAQLPQQAIISYQSLSGSMQVLRQTIKHWRQWLETRDESLVTAEIIYNQWLSLNGYIENTKKLREALIKKGHVSKSEANDILKERHKEFTDQLKKIIFPKSKLKPAEEAAKKFFDDFKEKKEPKVP